MMSLYWRALAHLWLHASMSAVRCGRTWISPGSMGFMKYKCEIAPARAETSVWLGGRPLPAALDFSRTSLPLSLIAAGAFRRTRPCGNGFESRALKASDANARLNVSMQASRPCYAIFDAILLRRNEPLSRTRSRDVFLGLRSRITSSNGDLTAGENRAHCVSSLGQ
jgi:hypothetical protein